jgi:outer membrane protein OmpA-like peptidoglycan-associated protein
MKVFATILFSLISSFCFSQSLVVNGGFEDENICTEYNINCAPEGWISTGNTYANFFKIPGVAHNGRHCVAIEAGNSRIRFMRTYIRTQLLCNLRAGGKYKLEFWVRSRHPIIDSIGVFFTSSDFLFEKQPRYKIIPSLYAAGSGQIDKADTNWQKIRLEYTATGDEVFMTLGNFSKRDITGETGIRLENHFYAFFDDVSLTPLDPNEKICESWQKMRDDIYSFNPRHEWLERYVKTYINHPPPPPVLEKTTLYSIDTLVLPDLFFETAKSDLSITNNILLDSLCNILADKMIDSLVIEGHTDNVGTPYYNQKLSEDRANLIADYLKQHLQPLRMVISRGWASDRPVAENKTPAGRQRNRRVEIFIYIRQ